MSGVTALRGAEELMTDKDNRGYDEPSAKIDPPSDGGGVDLSTDGQQVAGRWVESADALRRPSG